MPTSRRESNPSASADNITPNSSLLTPNCYPQSKKPPQVIPAAVWIDLAYRQAAALTSLLLTMERITNSVQTVMAAPMTRQIHAFWTKPAMM